MDAPLSTPPITAEAEAFAKGQLAVLDRATAVTVGSDGEAAAANDLLTMMRKAAEALEEKRVYLKAPFLEGGRRIDEFFNGSIDRLRDGAKAVKRKIDGYLLEQQRKAEEEAARLRAIQQAEREKAEREARKREEAAAKVRAEAEAKAAAQRAEAARLEAEGKAGEAAKAAQKAISIAEAGDAKASTLQTQANEARELAAAVPSAVAAPVAAPKGFSARTAYSAKVVDLKKLAIAVAEGRAPVTLIMGNEAGLNAYARAVKEGFDVPGCELVKTRV